MNKTNLAVLPQKNNGTGTYSSLKNKEKLELSPEQMELLKKTVCKGATDEEVKLFWNISQESGLDPFRKQIYGIKRKRKQGNQSSEEMVIQVGIDGMRIIVTRSEQYAGSDIPQFEYKGNNVDTPFRCTMIVYRVVNGLKCSFVGVAFWSEYYPGKEKGCFWDQFPHTMLEKCAEAKALRKAFPVELSGIYEHAEMIKANDNTVNEIVQHTQNPSKGDISNKEDNNKYGKELLNLFLLQGITDKEDQLKILASIIGKQKKRYTEQEKYSAIQAINSKPNLINNILNNRNAQVVTAQL